jgi:hypothetical protein
LKNFDAVCKILTRKIEKITNGSSFGSFQLASLEMAPEFFKRSDKKIRQPEKQMVSVYVN